MGLPTEGTAAAVPRAGDVARKDVPTCGPQEVMGAVRRWVRATGWDACVVVNEERVVLGSFRSKELEQADPDARAEEAMRPGPSTFLTSRPSEVVIGAVGRLCPVMFRAISAIETNGLVSSAGRTPSVWRMN